MANYQVTYEIQDTVTKQLRELFGTPKGSLVLDPDYGLDFSIIDTDVGYALDTAAFKANIRDQLRKYVPRVNAEQATITVKYKPTDGRLFIQINDVLINVSESHNGVSVKRP